MSDETFKLTLTATRAAMDRYDAGEAERDAMIRAAKSHEDVHAWRKAEAEALESVQQAFFEDTSDRNSRDHCRFADIKWIRGLLAEHAPDAEPG